MGLSNRARDLYWSGYPSCLRPRLFGARYIWGRDCHCSDWRAGLPDLEEASSQGIHLRAALEEVNESYLIMKGYVSLAL